ncbi:hypothetical protein FN846DRAFT_202162 [Sphaerosporella brunnea]|uniref:Rhodopsin domain-containing protein n=1 Tax=Sphaerosporella brunnea TaxID=1250544 RepID=A0A5J5F848_9PEZI|nr:hypothetical protein FN846DRAFT_202162 [Sphaerosporella brunnea]
MHLQFRNEGQHCTSTAALLQLGSHGLDGMRPSILPRSTADGLPHDDLSPRLMITAIVLCSLALLVVSCRIYGRTLIMRILGWDDYFMIVAALAALAQAICTCINAHAGSGKHVWDVPLRNVLVIIKAGNGANVSYIICLGFARASLLLQLLFRLAPSPRMRIFIWAFFALSWITTGGSLVVALARCKRPDPNTPYDGAKKGVNNDPCQHLFALQCAVSALNILSDVLVWLAPLQLIWRIKLPHRQKWALMLSFSLGGIVWIASIVRLGYIVSIQDVSKFELDPTYLSYGMALWATIEANTAVICTSTPSIHPVVKHWFPGLLGTLTANSGPGLSVIDQMDTYHTIEAPGESLDRSKAAPSVIASEGCCSTTKFAATEVTSGSYRGSDGLDHDAERVCEDVRLENLRSNVLS